MYLTKDILEIDRYRLHVERPQYVGLFEMHWYSPTQMVVDADCISDDIKSSLTIYAPMEVVIERVYTPSTLWMTQFADHYGLFRVIKTDKFSYCTTAIINTISVKFSLLKQFANVEFPVPVRISRKLYGDNVEMDAVADAQRPTENHINPDGCSSCGIHDSAVGGAADGNRKSETQKKADKQPEKKIHLPFWKQIQKTVGKAVRSLPGNRKQGKKL